MSAQAGVGLLVNPNMAECVIDWVPLRGRVCLLKLRLQKRSVCIIIIIFLLLAYLSSYHEKAINALYELA